MIFRDYPFKAGANEYEVLYDKIINTEPNYPSEIKDERVIGLLKKMLIKDPEKRASLKEVKNHEWVTANDKFPL